MAGLARTLRADFAAVESQFTLVDDPNGNIAKSMMGLVYGTAATDFFFGLLNDTLKTTVTYSNPVGQPTLAQPILNAASGRLSYDDLRKQLIYTGVLAAYHAGHHPRRGHRQWQRSIASDCVGRPVQREPQAG